MGASRLRPCPVFIHSCTIDAPAILGPRVGVFACDTRRTAVRSDGEVRPHRAPKSADVGDKDKTKYFFFCVSCYEINVFSKRRASPAFFLCFFFNARVSFSMSSSALSLRMLFVYYQWSDEEDG